MVFLKLKQDFNLGTLIAYLIIEYNLQNIQNKVGNRLFTVKINRYKKLDFFTSNEKEPEGKKKYENYFNSFKGKGRYVKEDYIFALFSQLTILYFHWDLSFPIVDVDFYLNLEESFNPKKMADFINKGIR